MFYALLTVNPKNVDRRSAYGRLAHEGRSLPRKVFFPFILAGIKERNQFAGSRIVTRGIRALCGVACGAGEAEVLQRTWSMVFLRPDMIELVRQDRIDLGQMAVFTTTGSPFPYLLPA